MIPQYFFNIKGGSLLPKLGRTHVLEEHDQLMEVNVTLTHFPLNVDLHCE